MNHVRPRTMEVNRAISISRRATGGRVLPIAAVKARLMTKAVAIIHIRRESEQRKILPIHVVLQIEHARKSGAGDLLFLPRAVGLLRAEQKAYAALNARAIEVAACTNAHYCPCCLGCCALSHAFGRRIFVGRAGLAPTPVIVLAALQPIAPAQDLILRHVLADCVKAAQHLPGTVDVIDTPSSVPATIVFMRLD